MTIGKPGTGAARALSVHFRIVSVALLIIADYSTEPATYGDAATVRQRPRVARIESVG
jgi:hypothetical protein